MLVRRIATVTICAPEASIAARVWAKSLYLPVPTSSRERYARPAMTNGSSCARARFSLGAFIGQDHQPPPTARTTSIRSPLASSVSARRLLGTISPLRSIATRLPSSASSRIRSAIVAWSVQTRDEPLTMIESTADDRLEAMQFYHAAATGFLWRRPDLGGSPTADNVASPCAKSASAAQSACTPRTRGGAAGGADTAGGKRSRPASARSRGSRPCMKSVGPLRYFHGSGVPARLREPVLLQTLAKRHPGPVQDDPQVGRRDRQFLTDLAALQLHDLAHHEHPRRIRRQLVQAELHDVEKLRPRELRFRVAPVRRRVFPVPRVVEQRVEILDLALLVER